MSDLQHILLTSGVGFMLGMSGWMWLARRFRAAGKSAWRAVVPALPLVLIPVLYGAFWLAFFTSPEMAIQAHATRLTLSHYVGPFLPLAGGLWLVTSAVVLWPLRNGFSVRATPQTQ